MPSPVQAGHTGWCPTHCFATGGRGIEEIVTRPQDARLCPCTISRLHYQHSRWPHAGVAQCIALHPKWCLCNLFSFLFCWSSWTIIKEAVSNLIATRVPVSQALAGVGLSNTSADVSPCVGRSSGPSKDCLSVLLAACVAAGLYPSGMEHRQCVSHARSVYHYSAILGCLCVRHWLVLVCRTPVLT